MTHLARRTPPSVASKVVRLIIICYKLVPGEGNFRKYFRSLEINKSGKGKKVPPGKRFRGLSYQLPITF